MEGTETFPFAAKVGAGVVVAVVLLVVLGFMSRPSSLRNDLKGMIMNAAQMHEISKQDSDPAIALMHASTAVAYLSIARNLASDASIHTATKIAPGELERIFKERQAELVSVLSPRALSSEPSLSALAAGYAQL